MYSDSLRPGERVILLTKSSIRYSGTFRALDSRSNTIVLTNVRSFGTENRPVLQAHPPSTRPFKTVVIKLHEIQSMQVIEYNNPLMNDPAVVRVQNFDSRNNFHDRPSAPAFNQGSHFNGHSRHGSGRPMGRNQHPAPFRANSRRPFNAPRLSEGMFPQKMPGAQSGVEDDYDFQENLKKFEEMKRRDTEKMDDSSDMKTVYEEGDFFDKLIVNGQSPTKMQHEMPRMKMNPNVETFGLDTVKSLQERRYVQSMQSSHRHNWQPMHRYRGSR